MMCSAEAAWPVTEKALPVKFAVTRQGLEGRDMFFFPLQFAVAAGQRWAATASSTGGSLMYPTLSVPSTDDRRENPVLFTRLVSSAFHYFYFVVHLQEKGAGPPWGVFLALVRLEVPLIQMTSGWLGRRCPFQTELISRLGQDA